MCAAAIWIAYTRHPFKKYRVLGRFWRPDWVLLRQLLVVGLPISGAFLLEYGLFAAAALLMGNIGTSAIAAHQIALQTAAVLYMVPFGISMAATVRVGQAVGRRDAEATRRAGFVAMILAVAFMVVMTAIVALTRHSIPLLFLGDGAGAAETMALAATLLVLGATFFITDGAQTVAAGALRGLERHARAAAHRGLQLLGRRLCGQLWLGLLCRARCHRCLDRPVARHHRVCRAAAVALSCADADAVHARCSAEPPDRCKAAGARASERRPPHATAWSHVIARRGLVRSVPMAAAVPVAVAHAMTMRANADGRGKPGGNGGGDANGDGDGAPAHEQVALGHDAASGMATRRDAVPREPE